MPPRAQRPPATTIGWRERVDLPALGLTGIVAKIDSGARTSALHATRLERFSRDGAPWLRFRVPHAGLLETVICEAPLVDRRAIRNTSGIAEARPVIVTTLVIAGRRWPIEVSLADRAGMTHPLILGRTALRRRGLLVDVGRSFLTTRRGVDMALRESGGTVTPPESLPEDTP
ncbi:RimK/LysX family protein [Limimaricola sp.]|uniref:ATP-dependent zinc protease family protein n=1 Tax=Limimaricola sp. TaxID=2211665 RepID=UPI0025B9AFC1|nr:RimK/LysX family protein [Limimaricola sp.]